MRLIELEKQAITDEQNVATARGEERSIGDIQADLALSKESLREVQNEIQ